MKALPCAAMALLVPLTVGCADGQDPESRRAPEPEPPAAGRAWVAIEPVQCLDNPWQKEWLAAHPDAPYGGASGSTSSASEREIIASYYSRKGIEIDSIERVPRYDVVCEACSCPEGHTLALRVGVEDVAAMLSLGYREYSLPVAWAEDGKQRDVFGVGGTGAIKALEPIDSTVRFSLRRAGGELQLILVSDRVYPSMTYNYVAERVSEEDVVHLVFAGIDGSHALARALGPARSVIPLGKGRERLTLVLESGWSRDEYRVALSGDEWTYAPSRGSFTEIDDRRKLSNKDVARTTKRHEPRE